MKQFVLYLCVLLVSVSAAAQPTAPDLVLTSNTSTPTAFQGSLVTASFTVTNSGTADAPATNVFFYQSADDVLTPGLNGDVALPMTYPVGTLAAGASTGPVTRMLPIPCTQPAGTYYIILVADGGNVVAESNETNNTASNSLTIQTLEVTTTAASVCAGSSVTLTASGAERFSWTPATGLSATTDASVTTTPAITTTYTVTGTTGICSATKTVTVDVTPVVTPLVSIGNTGCPERTLAFTATPTNGGNNPVVEWYVNNILSGTGVNYILNNAQNGTQVYAKLTSNAACATTPTATSSIETLSCIVPTIDLEPKGSVSPTNVVVGNSVDASFTINNTGNTEAPASKVAFYVSADANLTPNQNGDMSLGSFNLPAVPAGGNSGPVTRNIPIPCTFTPGNYYIFMVADGDNIISETNEGNNTLSTMVTVQPLQISVTPASASVCAGASTTLTASGATTYSWSPATGLSAATGTSVTATPTATTTYTVTGTANGCTATKDVVVTVTATVTPAITISYTGCPGNTLAFTASLTNGGNTPVVEWYVNNTLSGTGGSYTLNNAQNGAQVYAKLTSNAGCASPQSVNSTTVSVNCVTTSVPTVDEVEEITVSPNPTRDVVSVRLKLVKSRTVSLRVMDAHGKQVAAVAAERFSGVKSKTVDLHKAAAGVYYLQLQLDGEVVTQKILRIN